MTYFQNIPIFLRDGFVGSKNHMPLQRCFQTSYANIVQRRNSTDFFTPCNSSVNDFVPFYFSPLTKMAYTIHAGNVHLVNPNGLDLGIANMQDLVFLVCDVTKIAANNLHFWFSDVACNTLSQIPKYDNDLNNLDAHVDWHVFDEQPIRASIPQIGYPGVCQWQHDTDSRPNRASKRMAEFLVKDVLPLEVLECIVVKRDEIKIQIENWLSESDINIPVYTNTGCYY
ncbi:DUF4433 domain-containing protein [Kordiimonas lipolytica]|uniref:DUF4433 domain-containing protein n=1 Tax=Kordiimonas lipolytica TaxID=1662421 RepID=A0ABV8UDB1_9PROT|nr:DUF4433 domain-containing protein [Kordiimonas lipolytica]